MSSACRLFESLPDEVKKELAPSIVELAARMLIEAGRPEEAYLVVAEAVRQGYDSKLRSFKERIDKLFELQGALEALQHDIERILSSDRFDERDVEVLRRDIERVVELMNVLDLPIDARKSVEKVLRLGADLADIVAVLAKWRKLAPYIEQVKRNAIAILGTGLENLAPEDLRGGAATIGALVNELENLVRALEGFKPRTELGERLKFELLSRISDAVGKLRRFGKLLSALATVVEGYRRFVALMDRYGEGTNTLANTEYARELTNALAILLTGLRKLDEFAREGVRDKLTDLAIELVTRFKQWLDKLKEDLSWRNLWFLQVFENAENLAGFELKDVSIEGTTWLEWYASIAERAGLPQVVELIHDLEKLVPRYSLLDLYNRIYPKMEKLINTAVSSLYDYAKVQINSGANPVLGALAAFGAGLLDAISILMRPRALEESIKSLIEIGKTINEEVKKFGAVGVPIAIAKIGRRMFRDVADVSFFVGQVIAGLLLSKVVRVPGRLGRFLTDVLQGDPIGMGIGLIGEATARIRRALSAKLIRVGKYVELLADPRIARIVRDEKIVEEALRKYVGSIAVRGFENLARELRAILRRSSSWEEAVAKARKLARELSISELRELQRRYARILENLGKLIELSNVLKQLEKEVPRVEAPKIRFAIPEKLERTLLLKELRIRAPVPRIDFKTLTHALSGARSALEMLQTTVADLATILEKLSKIAPEYSTTLRRLLEELKGLSIEEAIRGGYIDRVRELLRLLCEISREHPELSELLGRIASSIEVRVEKVLLGGFSEKELATRLYEHLSNLFSKLSPELRERLSPLMQRIFSELRKGRIDVSMLEELARRIGEVAEIARLSTDYAILRSLVEATLKCVRELKRRWGFVPRISEELTKLENELATLAKIEARVLPIEPSVIEGLRELTGMVKVVAPDLATRAEQVIEKVIRALSEGRISKELVKEVESLAEALRGKVFPATRRIKEALARVAEAVKRLVGKGGVVEELAKEFADLVDQLRRSMIEVPEGYEVAELVAREIEAKPLVLVPAEDLLRLKRLISEEWRGAFEIGGKRFAVARKAIRLPDGTIKIMWMIIDDRGRKATLVYELRPGELKRGYVRARQAFYVMMDPELAKAHPELVNALREGIRFVEKIDPTASILERTIVWTRKGFVPIGSVINAALRSLPMLFAVARMRTLSPKEALLLKSLASDKKLLIRELARRGKPVPIRLVNELRRIGVEPIFAVDLPGLPTIVVGEIYPDFDADLITRGVVLEWRGEKVYVPILKLPSGEIGLLPAIDIDVPELEEEAKRIEVALPIEEITEKELSLRLRELETPTITSATPTPTTPTTPLPTPTPPIPKPVAPGLAVVRSSAKGIQLELLVL